MEVLKYLLIVVVGYLLGSVSISIILSRMLGSDVRKKGSGNAGATNMARVYGLGAGFLTLGCLIAASQWLMARIEAKEREKEEAA